MDFAPDGTLIMSQGSALWRVNPATGVVALLASGIATTGDFDIDAAGELRSIDQGRMIRYAAGTWAQVGLVALQRDLFAPSALLHR